ncbi:MAG: rhodanese-like domain-containing protein, partial [Marinirhabdus sp.]
MNNIKTVLVTTALFFSVAAVTAQQQLEELLSQYNTRSVPYISVEELRMQRANSTVALLDAREPEEFAASHLPSAQLVGFNYFSIEAVSAQIKDKNTPIVVYCSLGIRSEEIGEKLKKA